MDSTNTGLEGGASQIREKIEAKSKELGVQIVFDIDSSESLAEIEEIYKETLELLESLDNEEKEKLKKIAGDQLAINIENVESLNDLEEQLGRELVDEVEEPASTPIETKKQPSKWAELNNVLDSLGIDLEFNEEHLNKFEEKNLNSEQKYDEIREALESFPNKALLGQKFSKIRLGYPKFEQDSRIFIEDAVLFIDLGISKKEIIDFLNSLFEGEKKKDEGEDKKEEPVVPPVEPPLSPPEPPIAPVTVIEEQNVPEWRKGGGWEQLEIYRNQVIQSRQSEEYCLKHKEENQSVEEFRKILEEDYIKSKGSMANEIKESLRKEMGTDPLTPEQEIELNKKINDVLFDELVKNENDAYLNTLRKARSKTFVGKVLEGAKSLLGTKAVNWYRGLSREQRMTLSFGVGS